MQTVKDLLKRAVALARKAYQDNPVRVAAYATSAVIAGLAFAGVVVDPLSTASVVAVILAILFGGEVARQQVTPVAKAKKQVDAAKREASKKRRR